MPTRLFIILLLCSIATGCKKKKNDHAADTLPPATMVGANTFGCLIDGKVFVPKKKLFAMSVILQCNYEYINSEYYFMLAARNQIENYNVAINIDKLQITGDTVLSFSLPITGPMYGRCGATQNNFTVPYSTTNDLPGQLTFSKFDLVHQIASGTFWFDAIDSATGKIVEVRDGRFDVQFTR